MKQALSRAEQRVLQLTAARRAAEAAVSLEVALLGDGTGTPEYGKRLELQERLQSLPFVATVTIPEQLQEAYPDATSEEIEQSAIGEADVVLCLESPARPPLGLYTEVRLYFDDTTPEKWFLMRPEQRRSTPEDSVLIAGLAKELLSLIESDHYDPDEWADCQQITASFTKRLNLMAGRKLRRLRYRRGM